MKNRILAALLAAWLSLCLSGCSFAATDPKNLMAPPKANADQQAIHKLLQGSQPDITFIYPKSGEYRSAVIMRDFTGDGEKDAIGFYSLEELGGVEVQFLIQSGEGWRTAASFRNTAIQVDRVCFGDLTGDGVNDVLIGWGSAAGSTGRTAAVNVYHYTGDAVEEFPLGTYGEMAVTDFDGDGVSEVFTVDKFVPAEAEGDDPSPAMARVFAWSNGAMKKLCETAADNSISSYSSVAFGSLNTDRTGVVLDGAKADGSMTTQVFCLEGGALINFPDGVNSEEYSNPFSRPSSAPFLSRDINGDGRIEVPVASPLPGLSPEAPPDSTGYQVEWVSFGRDMSRRLAVRALMNQGENYWFPLPFEWQGRITASNDPARRTVTYFQVMEPEKDGDQLLGPPLFSIRVFTRSAWESRGQSGGYELLSVQNDLVYGMQVFTSDKSLLRNIAVIKQSFQLLLD